MEVDNKERILNLFFNEHLKQVDIVLEGFCCHWLSSRDEKFYFLILKSQANHFE